MVSPCLLARTQISWVGPVGFGFYISSIRIQFFLSFVNRQTRIVSRVGLVIRPIVGYALDNDFGIISTGESAFGKGPIVLGLAFVVIGHPPLALLIVAKVPRRFGRVFVDREVAARVDRIAFLAGLHDECLGKFVVGESRQTKHARRVRCRQIAAELIREVVEERLCLILTEPTHFPHDLMLARRGIEDEVWRRPYRHAALYDPGESIGCFCSVLRQRH